MEHVPGVGSLGLYVVPLLSLFCGQSVGMPLSDHCFLPLLQGAGCGFQRVQGMGEGGAFGACDQLHLPP